MVNHTSSVERAIEIVQEVASYRQDYAEQPEYDDDWSYTILDEAGPLSLQDRRYAIGVLLMAAQAHSHAVIRQADRYLAPRGAVSTLTRRTLAMTAYAGSAEQPVFDADMDECCLGAELKFVHGLEFHSLGKPAAPDQDAALILHDIYGNPCAYQKAVGHRYAYVWRSSALRTRAGIRRVPAGAIVEPMYDLDGNSRTPPHKEFAGAGLVGITGCVADDIEFVRFGLEVFPRNLRRIGLIDTAEDAYDRYRHHVGEATDMNSTVFATRMDGLMKDMASYLIQD